MTRLVLRSLAACVAALLPHWAMGAGANIEAGFFLDGDSTYCQGVRSATANPLEFLELQPHSLGRCPINLKIDIKATTVGLQSPMEVQWMAAVHPGDVPNNIFPNAVNQATRKPQDVIASLLRACKVGTNCAPDAIVVPQVVGSADAEVGPFDAQGRKQLRAYRFQFPSPGDYIIVGVVSLPGDSTLNVSAMQFIAFQRITVVDGVGPATVAPPQQSTATKNSTGEVEGEAKTDNIDFVSGLVKMPAPATAPKTEEGIAGTSTQSSAPSSTAPVDAAFSGAKSSSGGSNTSGGHMTLMLVAVVAGAATVAAVLFFVVARKKTTARKNTEPLKPFDPHSQAGIFRLTLSGQDDLASLSMGSAPKGMGAFASQRSLVPPLYTESSRSSVGTNSTGTYTAPKLPKPNQNQPNASVFSSGDIDIDMQSTTYSDLHDSSLSDLDRLSDATSYRQSSRMFSETSSMGLSDGSFSDFGSELSSSVGSRRSTELGPVGEYEV